MIKSHWKLKINWIRLDYCLYFLKITWLLNLIIIELDLIELDSTTEKNDKQQLKIINSWNSIKTLVFELNF